MACCPRCRSSPWRILLAIADESALYLNAAYDRAAARQEIMQIVGALVRALVVP